MSGDILSEAAEEQWARQSVIDTALAMSRSGLSPGRSGNVSMRFEGDVLITPTGMAYQDLLPEDIVAISLEGGVLGSERLPSSEWHFHCAIYRARPDVHAIVHTHSAYAAALSVHERPIPPFHYMVAVAGGPDIRCAPYATFGTEELAVNAVAALEGRKACLLGHHGQIACGETLEKTLELAEEVETLARQYVIACTLGEPPRLSAEEMARVLEKFKGYGKQPKEE